MTDQPSTDGLPPLLRARQVHAPAGLLPFGRSTLYLKEQAGELPKPIKLGARISVWRRSDIMAFLENAEKANG